MENQTRFNLNAAIESWRQELAAQPNLAPDDRRELETHLRDAIAGFRQRGLNDEESFWLARRRVGQPQQLGEEFVKANPARAWRERAFWIVLALSAIQLWTAVCPYLWGEIVSWTHYLPSWFQDKRIIDYDPLYTFAFFSPIFCFVILLSQGRINWVVRGFQYIFRSRLQFVLMALPVILAIHCYSFSDLVRPTIYSWPFEIKYQMFSTDNYWLFQYFNNLVLTQGWPLTLLVLIAWLMPTQNRKTPKRA
jgi:hypothetical protein